MLERQRLTTLWASTVCYRDSFSFLIENCKVLKEEYTKHYTTGRLCAHVKKNNEGYFARYKIQESSMWGSGRKADDLAL
jgi:hypothetical protein